MDNGEKLIGLYSKIEGTNEEYIEYHKNENIGMNGGSFRYYDALKIFEEISINGNNFNQTSSSTMNDTYYNIRDHKNEEYRLLEGTFKQRLRGINVLESEINNIWTYMMDTMISASTIAYPEATNPPDNKFTLEDVDNLQDGSVIGYNYLYIRSRDQSRQVDFGIHLRSNADLWLSKDLYKTTLLINGKEQQYTYNKKSSETNSNGDWVVNTGEYVFTGPNNENRAGDTKHNSGETYTRELRKSEYLYDGSDVTGKEEDDIKNLQVFVTYKISIKNQSQDIWTSVDEIVDYYDINQYNYFGVADNSIVKSNTFVGDANGNKIYDINVSPDSKYISKYGSSQGYYDNSNNIDSRNGEIRKESKQYYTSIYITGIKDTTARNMGNVKLRPGDFTYVYITFKVNNDKNTGKVMIDQEINTLIDNDRVTEVVETDGKKNIAEINGYSTFYGSGAKAGVIDLDSNPGSLKSKDINEKGDIKADSRSWVNRLEDDTDKASNLKLVIDIKIDPTHEKDTKATRSIDGYVFEDARTEVSNQAVIGNGVYNTNDRDVQENKDKRINGVTLQLVELVQEVNSEGFSTGNYTGEHIWTSVDYRLDGNEWKDNNENTKDPRYYSGTNKSKVIISGPGIFKVSSSDLPLNEGEYRFDSLPPGDFFVRFIYGDTTQTVLTKEVDDTGETLNEVQEAFSNLTPDQKQAIVQDAKYDNSKYDDILGNYDKILGTSGLNNVSYTGQDYKSTIYQKGVNQNPTVNNYNGIIGYISTETQNYNVKNANDKKAMYNYDCDGSDIPSISDAKDVYSYREEEMKYSMGSSVNSEAEGMQTLKNHRAEVLASGTQLTTEAKNEENYEQATKDQLKAIKELIENTQMVAQSGVINIEVEYNRTSTEVYKKEENGIITEVEELTYQIKELDLGLTERPEAQIELSKELTNIQIRLANNQILFDANQSVNNLVYGKHKKYTSGDYYDDVENGLAYRLRQDIAKEQKDRQEELVQVIMDEELMSGATVRLTYKIRVDNIGEVDYLDKDFYYLGQTSNPGWENISRTNARRIIDYVSNESNYDANYQNDVDDWRLITTSIILGDEKPNNQDNDLVNKLYEDNLNTYNVLITTNKLSGDLIPKAAVDMEDTESLKYTYNEIYLVLSTLLSNTIKEKNLIYTNLVEVLETTNTNGRRMQLSEVGNQPMPYQSEQYSIDESSVWVHPQELDSDSGQKVQISVPTGEDRNYNRMIVLVVSTLGIIGISIYVIKKKVLKK